MNEEEYINLILELLRKLSLNNLKRIYNFVNNVFVGRGD